MSTNLELVGDVEQQVHYQPKRVVYETISDKQKEALLGAFPDVQFVPTQGPNEHLLLHYSRRWLEEDALMNLSRLGVGKVVDIGGTPNRAGRVAAELKMRYHSVNPLIDSSDLVRELERASRHFSTCGCMGQSPARSCSCSTADGLLMVHTVYYFTPQELFDMIRRTRKNVAMVIAHRFDDMCGNIPIGTDESWYEVQGDIVEMQVRGNSHPYNHSSLFWMTGTGGITVKGGTLAWSQVKSAFGAVMYTFTTSAASIAIPQSHIVAPVVGTQLVEEDLRGLRNTQQIVGFVEETHKISAVQVLPFGFLVSTSVKKVVDRKSVV